MDDDSVHQTQYVCIKMFFVPTRGARRMKVKIKKKENKKRAA